MSIPYHKLPHVGIQTLSPYIPGKSSEALAAEKNIKNIIKLASNENPLGCSPLVLQALTKISPLTIATYPVGDVNPLRTKIAHKLSIPMEMITLGNGSDSLFPLLLACFALHRDKHLLTHEYAFIAYRIHAQTLGIDTVISPLTANWEVDIDAMIKTCNEQTGLIFLPNPNNPTGSWLPPEKIEQLLAAIPETTLLVVDEAYYEFIPHYQQFNTLSLIESYPNLIVSRTFSKAYGLAGLRLGYMISSLEIAAILKKAQSPFTVNEIALVAGMAALDDHDFIKKTIENNHIGMNQLKSGLVKLGLETLTSAGNFITFKSEHANFIYESLQNQGIIIRPLTPYGLDQYLRVTIGTPDQNKRFLDAIKKLIAIT